MTKEIKAKIAALQDELVVSQKKASIEFRKMFERPATIKMLKDVEALRDSMVPDSPEEAQLDAYLSIHRTIYQYLAQMHPDKPQQVEETTTAQPSE